MLLYIILPIAALALGIPLCRSRNGKLLYTIFMGLALFFIAAIRSNVGYDYNLYGSWFVQFPFSTINELSQSRIEKGFLIPFKLLSDFGVSFKVMFVIISAVISILMLSYIYRHSVNPCISVFSLIISGLYFNSMNFMRQFIAALIVMCALRFIKEKRFFRFAAFVLLASCFHVSALIMLLFYFILQIKPNKVVISVYYAVMLVIFLFSDKILDFVTKNVYTVYNQATELKKGLPFGYFAGFLVFFVVAMALRKLLVARNEMNNIYLSMMFFGVFFEFIGIKHGIISRFSLFFLIPAITILSAEIFEIIKSIIILTFKENARFKRIVSATVIVVSLGFCGLFYSYLLINNYNGVVPYNTVFSADEGGSDVASS